MCLHPEPFVARCLTMTLVWFCQALVLAGGEQLFGAHSLTHLLLKPTLGGFKFWEPLHGQVAVL